MALSVVVFLCATGVFFLTIGAGRQPAPLNDDILGIVDPALEAAPSTLSVEMISLSAAVISLLTSLLGVVQNVLDRRRER